jgi:hypothetical protein
VLLPDAIEEGMIDGLIYVDSLLDIKAKEIE